jgi:hypothetical protein
MAYYYQDPWQLACYHQPICQCPMCMQNMYYCHQAEPVPTYQETQELPAYECQLPQYQEINPPPKKQMQRIVPSFIQHKRNARLAIRFHKIKTKLCRSGKNCTYRDCNFAHSFHELRPNLVAHNFKTTSCDQFPKCQYDVNCDFKHDEVEERVNNCSRCSILYDVSKNPIAKICRMNRRNQNLCQCWQPNYK